MPLAGSTNAVLHLLSLARELDVKLDLDDFGTRSDLEALIAERLAGHVTVLTPRAAHERGAALTLQLECGRDAARAVFDGMASAVREMKALMNAARSQVPGRG